MESEIYAEAVFTRRQVVSLWCWAIFVACWGVLAVLSFTSDAWVAGSAKLATAMCGVVVIGVTTLKAART